MVERLVYTRDREIFPFCLKCSHAIFRGEMVERILSHLFLNEPKKYRRWIKKWIKAQYELVAADGE